MHHVLTIVNTVIVLLYFTRDKEVGEWIYFVMVNQSQHPTQVMGSI